MKGNFKQQLVQKILGRDVIIRSSTEEKKEAPAKESSVREPTIRKVVGSVKRVVKKVLKGK